VFGPPRRVFGGLGDPPGQRRVAGRSLVIAAASTAVVFGVIGFVIVNAPGWPRVQAAFFDPVVFQASLPAIVDKFWINVQLFLIAEVLILLLGLGVAVMRSLPGPVFFPLRIIAVAYADLFRAVPGLLVIFFLAFGMPTLRLPGVPTDRFFWTVIALTLVYSAYVSEVYRAGIESIHPSQEAAARSLGLSRAQALRFVIIPQAVRRVIPPLLNDFIGLQKDTALVSTLGVVEAFNQANIDTNATFNYTSYLAAAVLFVALTIPLARLTDWLILRDRRQRQTARVA
jgi:polar amino acid transport system permease protein